MNYSEQNNNVIYYDGLYYDRPNRRKKNNFVFTNANLIKIMKNFNIYCVGCGDCGYYFVYQIINRIIYQERKKIE